MLPLRGEGIDATPGAAGRDRRAHHPEPVHEVERAFARLGVPLLSAQRYVNRIDQWTLEVHHGENSGGDPPLRRAFN